MVELFGDEGAHWADQLPETLEYIATAWELRLGQPLEPLTYNFIVGVERAGRSPAILKIGFPGTDIVAEMAALRFFDGRGAVRMIRDDASIPAMLLDRVMPGTPLIELSDDDRATSIAAGVMRALHHPIAEGHSFPTVEQWASGLERLRQRFDGGTGPFPEALVDRAERLFEELIASMGTPVLLHGDLHHWNILHAGGDRWVAIDPKGIAGEAEYETGAFIRNPMPGLLERPDAPAILERRIVQFSDELGFDPKRVHGWALAQAVLSAWWSVEDYGNYDPAWMACAEALAEIHV